MATELLQKTVLIVDDDKNMQSFHRLYLERQDLRVCSAYDIDSGLDQLLQVKPDLILLDYMMAGGNGCEFLQRRLDDAEFEEVRAVPVIMLTAATLPNQERKRLMSLGLTACLQKPFGRRELMSILESTLALHSTPTEDDNVWQSRLQSQPQFLEMVFRQFPGILFMADEAGNIRYFTDGCLNNTGWAPEQVRGKMVSELLSLDIGVFMRFANAETQSKTLQREDLMFQCAEGYQIPVDLSLTRLEDDEGRTLGFLGICRDMLVVRKLEEARFAKEKVQGIAQAMATVNHEINNPLTPILGNLNLLMEDAHLLPSKTQDMIESVRSNAEVIYQKVRRMSQISTPIFKEYYKGEMIIDIENSK